jgi:outer membrane lipoprotein LolB
VIPVRALLPLLAALLVGGCAVPQLPDQAEDRAQAEAGYRERAARLAELASWELRGRVVAKGPGESGQARIRWSRSGDAGRLAVSNPFGQTLLEVRSGSDGLSLRDARGGVFHGGEVHAVLRERLGWRVPIGRLADWALGLAPGDQVPEDLDGRGRPRHLRAGPWTVTFSEYMRVDGLWLPQSMRVARDGMQLRIRVDRWRLQWADGDGAQSA